MDLLLDTYALIHLLGSPERLKPAARDAIGDPNRTVDYSPVNVWEIEI